MSDILTAAELKANAEKRNAIVCKAIPVRLDQNWLMFYDGSNTSHPVLLRKIGDNSRDYEVSDDWLHNIAAAQRKLFPERYAEPDKPKPSSPEIPDSSNSSSYRLAAMTGDEAKTDGERFKACRDAADPLSPQTSPWRAARADLNAAEAEIAVLKEQVKQATDNGGRDLALANDYWREIVTDLERKLAALKARDEATAEGLIEAWEVRPSGVSVPDVGEGAGSVLGSEACVHQGCWP